MIVILSACHLKNICRKYFESPYSADSKPGAKARCLLSKTASNNRVSNKTVYSWFLPFFLTKSQIWSNFNKGKFWKLKEKTKLLKNFANLYCATSIWKDFQILSIMSYWSGTLLFFWCLQLTATWSALWSPGIQPSSLSPSHSSPLITSSQKGEYNNRSMRIWL